MNIINKKIFLSTINCKTYGWNLYHKSHIPPLPEYQKLLKEDRKKIIQLVREIFAHGFLINSKNWIDAAVKTQKKLEKGKHNTFFKATFIYQHYTTTVDILEKTENGLDLYLIKVGSSYKEEYASELAYIVSIILKCGYTVNQINLVLLNKEYKLDMDIKNLFVFRNIKENVIEKLADYQKYFDDDFYTILSAKKKPKPQWKYACKKCDLFSKCLGKRVKKPIFFVPDLSKKVVTEFIENKIYTIHEIPKDFELNQSQQDMIQSMKTNKKIVKSQLKEQLKKIKWPCYYLDFEGIMPSIPIFRDNTPFTHIPFQFSIHKYNEIDDDFIHISFLANSKTDFRQEIALKLIEALEQQGSIITYSSFEQRMIQALISWNPHLEKQLKLIIERLVDLELIIKNNYYHPKFEGKTSIKKVLPALAPKLAYDDLEIADGSKALAIFMNMVNGKYSEKEETEKRDQLLKYCERDTLAMVVLHQKLLEVV